MKRFRYSTLLFPVAFLLSAPAVAEPDTGFYASAIAGVGFLGSEDLNYRDGNVNQTAKGDFDPSFAGGATVGYRFTDTWRIEGEILYRRNDLEDVTLDGIGASTDGDYASLGLGLSALYNFKPFDNPDLGLYAGAGVVFVEEIDIDFEVQGEEISFETDDVGFQVQFGVRYDFGDPFFVDVGVRYLTLSGVEMEFPADTSRVLEAGYSPLTLTAGFGWRF